MIPSPNRKHNSMKKFSPTSSSCAYYKFSYGDGDDISVSSGEATETLSPREYVDKILKETELPDEPLPTDDFPEVDFKVDFLSELDNALRPQSVDFGSVRPSVVISGSADNLPSPEVLRSPLDLPDSGYIDIFTTPCSSGLSLDPRHHANLELISDNESICSNKIPGPKQNPTTSSVVRFQKYNWPDEDNYIDDEIDDSYASPGSYPDVTDCDVTDLELGDFLPMDGAQLEKNDFNANDIPMTGPYMSDTDPIMSGEQGLNFHFRLWLQQRKRLKIAIITLSIFCTVALIIIITYLVVKYAVL